MTQFSRINTAETFFKFNTYAHTSHLSHCKIIQLSSLARMVARFGCFACARVFMACGCLGLWRGERVITLENLTVSYRQLPALHHVSGHFSAGSLSAVIGPNGSGKSTIKGLLRDALQDLPAKQDADDDKGQQGEIRGE